MSMFFPSATREMVRSKLKTSFHPYETRETVRNKLKSKEYVTREFKGRSSVWASFLVVTTTDGVPVNYVICKDCAEVFTYKGHSSGTSTLRKHVIKCNERTYGNFPDQIETTLKSISRALHEDYLSTTSNVDILGRHICFIPRQRIYFRLLWFCGFICPLRSCSWRWEFASTIWLYCFGHQTWSSGLLGANHSKGRSSW